MVPIIYRTGGVKHLHHTAPDSASHWQKQFQRLTKDFADSNSKMAFSSCKMKWYAFIVF